MESFMELQHAKDNINKLESFKMARKLTALPPGIEISNSMLHGHIGLHVARGCRETLRTVVITMQEYGQDGN